MNKLSGPWWINNDAIDPEKEEKPQEAFFRVEFDAEKEISLKIAAQNFYQFWLDGAWMGYGPARASHGRLTVDAWRLPLGAVKDRHVVAVQVFWEAIFVFDHVRGTPAMWMGLESCCGHDVPFDIYATDKTGRLATHRASHQRGWVEEVDRRAQAAGWPAGPWDAEEWTQPVLRRDDPGVVLEARDIKPYAFDERKPRALTFVGACDPKRRAAHRTMGYATRRPLFDDSPHSPARLIQEEALLPSAAADRNLAGMLACGGAGPAVLAGDPDGMDRTVQVDFGQEVSGLLELAIEAPAGTVVDIGWSEGLWQADRMGCWARSAQPDGSVAPREMCDTYQGARLICRGEGVERFEGLFLVALRNLRAAFRQPTGKNELIRIHLLAVRTVGCPIERQGEFRCSDEDLNRIYEAAVQTMENSIADVFMDCPGRERGAYLNDSYWNAGGFLAVTDDLGFERRFLRQFLDGLRALTRGGISQGLYPSEAEAWLGADHGMPPILEHALFLLLQMDRHLRRAANRKLKAEWRTGIETVFAQLARYRNAEGLLENTPWLCFLDWSHYSRAPIQTASNFLYARALARLGGLYGCDEWMRHGRETLASVEDAAWDGGRGLYADTISRQASGKLGPGDGLSEVSNYIALWTETVPGEKARRVWQQLRGIHPRVMDRPLFDYETNLTRANLYGLLYRFDVAGRFGDGLARDLKEVYLPMLDRGQTALGEHLGYQSSLCHGLNAYVVHVMARHVAGIALPDSPDGKVVIKPHPETVAWCQARVPWQSGYVQIWWDRKQLMCSLPAGCKGELILPGMPEGVPFEELVVEVL